MKNYRINILVVLLSSLIFSACSSKQPKFEVLDERAGYQSHRPALSQIDKNSSNHPSRSDAELVSVYMHPHEMPSGDYFLGAWLSLVVQGEHWNAEKMKTKPNQKQP